MKTFFVLSTGRAGTQSLAHCLSQSPDTVCLHEPDPPLIRTSTLYTMGMVSRKQVAARIRRSRPLVEDTAFYGETNNRFALVLEPLIDVFPDARFVWVQRDGRQFVASQLQRGAYAGNVARPGVSTWERWRPRGDRTGSVPADTWKRWTRVQKLAWLWTWTNQRIETHLADRPCFQVRTDTLASQLQPLADFLGLPDEELVLPRSNSRRVGGDEHPNAVTRIQGFADWSLADQRAFDDIAGPSMDAWFPGWRDTEPVLPPTDTRTLTEAQRLQCENGILKVQLAEARIRQRQIAENPGRAAMALARSLLQRS